MSILDSNKVTSFTYAIVVWLLLALYMTHTCSSTHHLVSNWRYGNPFVDERIVVDEVLNIWETLYITSQFVLVTYSPWNLFDEWLRKNQATDDVTRQQPVENCEMVPVPLLSMSWRRWGFLARFFSSWAFVIFDSRDFDLLAGGLFSFGSRHLRVGETKNVFYQLSIRMKGKIDNSVTTAIKSIKDRRSMRFINLNRHLPHHLFKFDKTQPYHSNLQKQSWPSGCNTQLL